MAFLPTAPTIYKAVAKANPFAKAATQALPEVEAPQQVQGQTIDTSQFSPARIRDVTAPNTTTIDTSQSDQSRAYQNQLMQQLSAQAQGQGPSLAQMQMQRGQEANIAAQRANLNSTRGAPSPLAARAAAQNIAQTNLQTTQDAAMARLAEQQAAQQGLAGVASQARSQDQAQAQAQATLDANRNLAMYQGQLQTAMAQGQIDQNTADQLLAKATQEAQMRYNAQVFNSQAATGENAANIARVGQQNTNSIGEKARQSAMFGQVLGAGAQVGAAAATGGGSKATTITPTPTTTPSTGDTGSDEKLKKDIKPGNEKLGQFLDAINAHAYKYKDKKFGKGEYVSPMAQELEKTDLGKGLVKNTSEGKMVDYGHGFGTMMAAMAEMHKRLKKLEG